MIDVSQPLSSGVDVVVTREGARWVADLPRYPQARVTARTFPGLDQAVRDAIIIAEDLPEASAQTIPLHYEYRLP